MTEERGAMTDGTLGHSASLPRELTLWESLRLGNKGGCREGMWKQTSQNTGEWLWEWGQ